MSEIEITFFTNPVNKGDFVVSTGDFTNIVLIKGQGQIGHFATVNKCFDFINDLMRKRKKERLFLNDGIHRKVWVCNQGDERVHLMGEV